MNTERRIEILTQNRAEELLLELLMERLWKFRPDPEEQEAEAKKVAERGYPYTPEETARMAGFDEGWDTCYEQLRQIIENHNEENGFRK